MTHLISIDEPYLEELNRTYVDEFEYNWQEKQFMAEYFTALLEQETFSRRNTQIIKSIIKKSN